MKSFDQKHLHSEKGIGVAAAQRDPWRGRERMMHHSQQANQLTSEQLLH